MVLGMLWRERVITREVQAVGRGSKGSGCSAKGQVDFS